MPVLEGHFCTYFPSFNGNIRDTTRCGLWRRDFDSLLALNQVPQFATIKFPNDHTEGTAPGRPTPFAHVADNDLAVGMFIEHLSKTPLWNESVVLLLKTMRRPVLITWMRTAQPRISPVVL